MPSALISIPVIFVKSNIPYVRGSMVDMIQFEFSELEDEQQAVKALLGTFGYLPLAIDQAGAYIHTMQYTYRGYLEKYEANAKFYLGPKGKVNKNEQCVLITWELSYENIQKENRQAAELLLLCGFLGNDDICEDLLRKGKRLSKNGMSAVYLV